ncbi:hypothetical protein C446_14654 [Halobiforma nitratireducens JCM 10879]|uniref:Halobacterial output domain-containing protein n=2 Tax=Halobiforma nitratireducens TaxID=130048 RepID=M0LFN4_9EURY|nr:hypothetical protein C446_14654 [Halobiforma nitratireducens JCM 10879]
MAIVDFVARETGTDAVELSPLYDAVDPDALDSLLRSDGFAALEFEYEGRTVEIEDADGSLRISFADGTVTAEDSQATVDAGSSPSL